MIVAFSTSSPFASVAALAENGDVLWSGQRNAPMQASGACLELLEEMRAEVGLSAREANAFAADLGPGSFTGVRVGVILAKTLAFVYGVPVMGADAFDLVSPREVVAMPSKRGEFFVRIPGRSPVRTMNLPEESFLGFGPGIDEPVYPSAAGFAPLVAHLERQDAVAFVPRYLIEPSISQPKQPFGAGLRGPNG